MLDANYEYQRLASLNEAEILDTDPEAVFDNLTRLAADLFDTPISLISLVDANRQWFKSTFGIGIRSTSRDVSFCDFAIRSGEVMIVADAAFDDRFKNNPFVVGEPFIRFYAGAPIRYNGSLIGTMCIIDYRPRYDFCAADARRLKLIATAVSSIIELRKDSLFKVYRDIWLD